MTKEQYEALRELLMLAHQADQERGMNGEVREAVALIAPFILDAPKAAQEAGRLAKANESLQRSNSILAGALNRIASGGVAPEDIKDFAAKAIQ